MDYTETEKFLETLFSKYFEEHDGYVELRFIGQDAISRFYRRGEITNRDWAEITELNKTHHVYFGVNPRTLDKAKKKDDIQDIICLWADVDGGYDGVPEHVNELVKRAIDLSTKKQRTKRPGRRIHTGPSRGPASVTTVMACGDPLI